MLLASIARKVFPARVRWVIGRLLNGKREPISYDYQIIQGAISLGSFEGWCEPAVAKRQHRIFTLLLHQMHEGKPREDFLAVANAVKMTGLDDPLIVEIGCGSGWNSEVLTHLLKHPIRYIGLDYSMKMVKLGKQYYPDTPFIAGDATSLPLRDQSCDVLISGTVLMHLMDYRKAIEESKRVTRKWCIFHTVPVLQRHATTLLRKRAYGSWVIEVIFNEEEFCRLIKENGLVIREKLDSIPYDLKEILGEPTVTKTYLCEIQKV